MKCNHEWYEGRCVHCHADPSSAAIIDQLRQQLTEAEEQIASGIRTIHTLGKRAGKSDKRAEKAEAQEKKNYDIQIGEMLKAGMAIEKLEQKNKRLREALEKIRDMTDMTPFIQIAEQALKEEVE